MWKGELDTTVVQVEAVCLWHLQFLIEVGILLPAWAPDSAF